MGAGWAGIGKLAATRSFQVEKALGEPKLSEVIDALLTTTGWGGFPRQPLPMGSDQKPVNAFVAGSLLNFRKNPPASFRQKIGPPKRRESAPGNVLHAVGRPLLAAQALANPGAQPPAAGFVSDRIVATVAAPRSRDRGREPGPRRGGEGVVAGMKNRAGFSGWPGGDVSTAAEGRPGFSLVTASHRRTLAETIFAAVSHGPSLY